MKISATIITLNEERNIERCIRSLQSVVDEIIVLDSNSTDKTEEICNRLGVRFIQREWEGYSATKNYANSQATHSYILSMDADEALDKVLMAEIVKIKKLGSPQIYSVSRLTNYCGKWIKHSGWYPDIKVRLFPKDSCCWQGEYVHEELSYPIDLDVIQLNGNLQHFSYYSFKGHRERADNYSRLTALKMHKAGKKASFLKPYLSALVRFLSMYVFKLGFLDGKMGFKIAQISAQSNIFKYQELRRLNSEAH
ncbi:MAG: glycosyltransferase family 2 protein [Crocinitomicaceae bacterium]|nr:glycosyltransferase family 2 protein [Crocinitomicaceae bacterium]